MNDYSELKAKAEAHMQKDRIDPIDSKRVMLVEPATVFELIAENERLERNRDMWKSQVERQAEELSAMRTEVAEWKNTVKFNEGCWSEERSTMIDKLQAERAENEESQSVIDSLAKVLAEIAVTLKGEELPLHRHGYQDLPELVAVLKLENDLRKAADGESSDLSTDEHGDFSDMSTIWCACGDGYAANGYGAGFMAANDGVCENCDAANTRRSEQGPEIAESPAQHVSDRGSERA